MQVLSLTFLAFSRRTANYIGCGLLWLCCCYVPLFVSCVLICSPSDLPETKGSFNGMYLPEELWFDPLAIRMVGSIWHRIRFSGLWLPFLVVVYSLCGTTNLSLVERTELGCCILYIMSHASWKYC